jgi:N-acetylglutamate synthase-like GNAT family acetyltransferase
MIIRKATNTDIPQIIELLKVSLGESLIPKSEALWRWKHLDNPFGASPTLVALDREKIIGVRTFLRWEFIESTKLISTCRAVDTAIHPDYQGQGLFKKLTLELIESLKEEGIELIFNTPNTASLPGYLKMGWKKWGKLPLKLNFHFHQGRNELPINPEPWSQIETVICEIAQQNQSSSGLNTNLLPGYLAWRYRDCPLFPYHFISDGDSCVLFYRIKEGKMGRELRITDFFARRELLEKEIKEIQKKLTEVEKLAKARFTSYSGLKFTTEKIVDMGILPIIPMGPIVTIRQVNPALSPLTKNWNWSLGDLEVF